MNKRVASVLKVAAVVFVVIYLFAQVYSGLINPVTTDTVYIHSSYSGYDTTGFIVRNETVISSKVDGILSYEVSDGGRVAKGGTIATAYSNSLAADNRIKIEQLDKRIATLEKIQNYNDLNAVDLTSVNNSIHSAIMQIANSTQGGQVNATEHYDILLENMARRQIITGEATNFNTLLTTLKQTRDSLKASVGESGGRVVSPNSGYVIYTVDGYENTVKIDDMANLTADRLKSLTPENVSSDSVCKIVSDYEWYIAAIIPFSESLNLKDGSSVTLRTSLQSVPELTATVKYINKQSVGSDAVVVFACDTMNFELAQTRNVDITIVYKQYDGLKVDNRAIRIVDGQKGVYVLLASQVRFVPVEVIWSGENFSIVKREASEKKVLRIYDEIIVKGKNLYDGKIIE